MSLFQSNLRKQIRKLPKILKFVKVIIIQYYSVLFIRVLNGAIRGLVDVLRVVPAEAAALREMGLHLGRAVEALGAEITGAVES